MRKFEVCIRGQNFLIKKDKKTQKASFLAGRYVEAEDMSAAVQMVMNELRTELKGEVFNKETDPPKTTVEEVCEVYYFQNEITVGSKVIPVEGIIWDEENEKDAISVPISAWKGGWSTLRKSAKEGDLHLHTMLLHFTNALYPVALLFIILYLIFGKDSFQRAYFYIMVLATLSAPVSYLSGILEWKRRHQGAMIPIFIAKIRYGMVVFVLGAAATLWFFFSPGVLSDGGITMLLFILLNLSILVPLIYLSHLGGMIVYEGVEKED